jgi:hypothetical protein
VSERGAGPTVRAFFCSASVVRNENRFGVSGQAGDEPAEEIGSGEGAGELRDEEERCVSGANSGESVGQGSRDGYGWIGEGSGRGEPVG